MGQLCPHSTFPSHIGRSSLTYKKDFGRLFQLKIIYPPPHVCHFLKIHDNQERNRQDILPSAHRIRQSSHLQIACFHYYKKDENFIPKIHYKSLVRLFSELKILNELLCSLNYPQKPLIFICM